MVPRVYSDVMRQRVRRSQVLLVLFVVLFLPFIGGLGSRAQSPPERILFAVWPAQHGKDPNAPIIDPIGALVGSHIRSLGDLNKLPDAFFDRFEKNYYAPGRTFPLLLGGSNPGQITIQRAVGISCVSLDATAKLPISLPDPQMALVATSIGGLGLHENWRKPPTPGQRSEFLQLSAAFLRRKPLSTFAPSDLTIESLYSTKLGSKEPDSLIGSVTLTQKTAISHLLLAATSSGSRYKILLASFHSGDDVEDHTDDVSEQFVDQLDIDNDGVDEILTLVGYYESWDYIVYKRVNGAYRKIYEGGGGGC